MRPAPLERPARNSPSDAGRFASGYSIGAFLLLSGAPPRVPFKARFLKTSAPSSIDGIEKYLGSGMIRGIGPVYAKKMVKAFGEKIFDVIEAEPDRLREVTGIERFGASGSRMPGPSRRSSGRSWSSFTAAGSVPRGRFASSRPKAACRSRCGSAECRCRSSGDRRSGARLLFPLAGGLSDA